MQKNEGSRFSFRHEIYYLVTKLTIKFTSRYAFDKISNRSSAASC